MTNLQRIVRVAAALLLAMFGVAVVGLGFEAAAGKSGRTRDTGMPTAKLRELQSIAKDVDIIVVGTSRLLHGFDPAAFEAETQRLGRPLRAYNLSLQRLLLWEQERILTDALALPRLKPRLIIIEPAVGLGLAPENFTHARTIEYETPDAWWTAVRVIRSTDRSFWHQSWNIATHTLVLALHATHYGAATNVAFPSWPESGGAGMGNGIRGFIPLATTQPSPTAKAQVALWCDQHRHDFATTPGDTQPLPAAMRDHFLKLRTRLEATGARVVFVQPPQLGFTTEELRRLTRRFEPSISPYGPVLNFLDPAQHPSLFQPALWSDYNHLNANGAVTFTRELASALAPLLPPPGP